MDDEKWLSEKKIRYKMVEEKDVRDVIEFLNVLFSIRTSISKYKSYGGQCPA